MHGIGHGFLIAAYVNATSQAYSACSSLRHIDKNIDKNIVVMASTGCLAAPYDDYQALCGEGLFHGVYEYASKMVDKYDWAEPSLGPCLASPASTSVCSS